MDKRTLFLILIYLQLFNTCFAQEYIEDLPESLSELFLEDEIMHVSLRYSNKDMKKETNDSTYITTYLKYKNPEVQWDSLEVDLRRRGNFRLLNCYYAPVKIKIKKKKSKDTPFEGHKNLKLVLPCLVEREKNDNIIKEYLAYKIYEIVSPYHFKTRLVRLDYEEVKNKNLKLHEIMGFLVEDDKHVAKRIGGKIIEMKIHPLNQMPLESVRNSFFQFMIGNTDFSHAYQHNTKLIYLEGKIIPVPYDFDMAGMVFTSYATVSMINKEKLEIEDVKHRLYRGFQRDEEIFTEVRLEFLAKRLEILAEIQECEYLFENKNNYIATIEYIEEFFEILRSDKRFEKDIVKMARVD